MSDSGFAANPPRARRIGAMACVGLAHVLVILGLLHERGLRMPGAESVVVAHLVEASAEAPRSPQPMTNFSLRVTLPHRLELPVPDVVVQDLPSAPIVPSPATERESIGLANHAAQPVAARAGPPEIQNVQYARPIMLEYPPVSRRLNESGVVIVRVLIDPDGKPVEVIVQKSSGHSRLDAAAVAAVRSALFRPYRENGVALPAQALVPIRFELG